MCLIHWVILVFTLLGPIFHQMFHELVSVETEYVDDKMATGNSDWIFRYLMLNVTLTIIITFKCPHKMYTDYFWSVVVTADASTRFFKSIWKTETKRIIS